MPFSVSDDREPNPRGPSRIQNPPEGRSTPTGQSYRFPTHVWPGNRDLSTLRMWGQESRKRCSCFQVALMGRIR